MFPNAGFAPLSSTQRGLTKDPRAGSVVATAPLQVDPSPPASSAAAHREAFPLFWSGRPPLVAEVGPGETLYLPALWHHHVAQRPLPGTGNDRVLAVNFW